MGINNVATSDQDYKPRNIRHVPFVLLLLIVVLYLLHAWVNLGVHKSAQVEFQDMPDLKQYEWLNNNADYIAQFEEKISKFRSQIIEIENKYVDYGNESSWPTHIRALYDKEIQLPKEGLKIAVQNYNEAAKEYNLNSDSFDWAAFEDNIQKPPRYFEEIIP